MTDHDLLIRIDERVGTMVSTVTDHGVRITALEYKKPNGGWILKVMDFIAEMPAVVHVLITGSMAVVGVVTLIIACVKKH